MSDITPTPTHGDLSQPGTHHGEGSSLQDARYSACNIVTLWNTGTLVFSVVCAGGAGGGGGQREPGELLPATGGLRSQV